MSGATPEKFFGVTMRPKDASPAPPARPTPPPMTGTGTATSANTTGRDIVPAVNVSFGIGVPLSLATNVRRGIGTAAGACECAAHHP